MLSLTAFLTSLLLYLPKEGNRHWEPDRKGDRKGERERARGRDRQNWTIRVLLSTVMILFVLLFSEYALNFRSVSRTVTCIYKILFDSVMFKTVAVAHVNAYIHISIANICIWIEWVASICRLYQKNVWIERHIPQLVLNCFQPKAICMSRLLIVSECQTKNQFRQVNFEHWLRASHRFLNSVYWQSTVGWF